MYSLCPGLEDTAHALREPSAQIGLNSVICEVRVFDRIRVVSLFCPQGLHQLLPRTCVHPSLGTVRSPCPVQGDPVRLSPPAGGPLCVPRLSHRPVSEMVLVCQTGLLCVWPLC